MDAKKAQRSQRKGKSHQQRKEIPDLPPKDLHSVNKQMSWIPLHCFRIRDDVESAGMTLRGTSALCVLPPKQPSNSPDPIS